MFYEENKPCMAALGIAEGEAARVLERCGYRVRALTDPARDIVTCCAAPATATARRRA